jgi:hypothetical protein
MLSASSKHIIPYIIPIVFHQWPAWNDWYTKSDLTFSINDPSWNIFKYPKPILIDLSTIDLNTFNITPKLNLFVSLLQGPHFFDIKNKKSIADIETSVSQYLDLVASNIKQLNYHHQKHFIKVSLCYFYINFSGIIRNFIIKYFSKIFDNMKVKEMSDIIALDLYHQGFNDAQTRMMTEDIPKAEAKGKAEGKAEANADKIVKVLRTKPDANSMDKSLITKIKSIKDLKLLDKVFDYALMADTISQFINKSRILKNNF